MKRISRAKRLKFILGNIKDAKGGIEELMDELQDWLDNMPENLQQSSKAQEIQEALGNLGSIQQSLEEALSVDVTFPGMC